MNIKKLLETVEEKNLSITDLKISDITPNVIDDVIISINKRITDIGDEEKRCVKHLPHSMSGEKFASWKKGRGGIFYKDIIKFIHNKETGKYVLLEGDGERNIARLIEDSELEIFSLLKLVDGKIKDKAFMILRSLNEEDNLTSTARYIDQTEELEVFKINIPNISSNSEDSDDPRGIPLFED